MSPENYHKKKPTHLTNRQIMYLTFEVTSGRFTLIYNDLKDRKCIFIKSINLFEIHRSWSIDSGGH